MLYFIAATEQHWKANGVLLVTLDDDDSECNVDSFRSKAETSGLSWTNLQVGNTDWLDETDGDEIGNEDDDKLADEDDDEEVHKDGSDGGNEDTVGKIATFTYGVPPQPSPTGFFIDIYAKSDTKGTALIRRAEPAADMKSADEFICRLQSDSSFASSSVEGRITQAFRYHPYRTQQNRHLHPNLFLLSFSHNTQEDRVILIHLN